MRAVRRGEEVQPSELASEAERAVKRGLDETPGVQAAGVARQLPSISNFRRLVLGCMDTYDSEQRRIFLHFSRSTVAPTGEKKRAHSFSSPEKKNIWRGAP